MPGLVNLEFRWRAHTRVLVIAPWLRRGSPTLFSAVVLDCDEPPHALLPVPSRELRLATTVAKAQYGQWLERHSSLSTELLSQETVDEMKELSNQASCHAEALSGLQHSARSVETPSDEVVTSCDMLRLQATAVSFMSRGDPLLLGVPPSTSLADVGRACECEVASLSRLCVLDRLHECAHPHRLLSPDTDVDSCLLADLRGCDAAARTDAVAVAKRLARYGKHPVILLTEIDDA